MNRLFCLVGLLAGLLASPVFAVPAPIPAPTIPDIDPRFDLGPSEITMLTPQSACDRCTDSLIMTRFSLDHDIRYGIISDLPESFIGFGNLYSTRDVLDDCGMTSAPIPAALRKQIKVDPFMAIDDSFDVFFFHLQIKDKEQAQRIVVYVKNNGKEPVTIEPKQVIKQEGTIGTTHDFESTIAKRVFADDWDQPIKSVKLEPGTGAVIAYGKRFGNIDTGDDASRNVNCFGYVRALVKKESKGAPAPNLQVDVVAIPATPVADVSAETPKWVDKPAMTTDEVDMTTAPQNCALGRAVGVYPYGTIHALPMVFDAAQLTEEGHKFPIALPRVQTEGCRTAAQTLPLLLRPGYTREDTIGNYMIPYDVRLGFMNTGDTPKKVEVYFAKKDADVGLVYQTTMNKTTVERYKGLPVKWKWAGPKQSSTEAAFTAPIEIGPKEEKIFSVRFMIIGNSSLPFTLGVREVK